MTRQSSIRLRIGVVHVITIMTNAVACFCKGRTKHEHSPKFEHYLGNSSYTAACKLELHASLRQGA